MPVVKLQMIPVTLDCSDSPQSPGRGAEPARAGAFKVTVNYITALLPSPASSPSTILVTSVFLGAQEAKKMSSYGRMFAKRKPGKCPLIVKCNPE